MDLEREFRLSLISQKTCIDVAAMLAVRRVDWMHAVGSGICGCGADVEGHSVWDNHSPVEMPRDKGYYD